MSKRHLLVSLAAAGAMMISVTTTFAREQSPADTTNGSEQPVTDTWITTKVKAELATTDGVKSTDISVTTVDGVVTLSGMLTSPTGIDKAVAAAKSIKGVKRVDATALKSS